MFLSLNWYDVSCYGYLLTLFGNLILDFYNNEWEDIRVYLIYYPFGVGATSSGGLG